MGRAGSTANSRGEGRDVMTPSRKQGTMPERSPVPGVRNVLAVASGKGGVGKSTISANLAVALARTGARVGLLDADIYGPSVPTLLGLKGRKLSGEDGQIVPAEAHGLKVVSIGFLLEEDSPVIWRGPM